MMNNYPSNMSIFDLHSSNWKKLMTIASGIGTVSELAHRFREINPHGNDRNVTRLPPGVTQPWAPPPGLDSGIVEDRPMPPGVATQTSMKLLSPLVGSEATTYSHYRFHPKKRKQRFSYNKFTCTKGSITDHNCYTVQSSVAQTAWRFSALMTRVNMVQWQQFMPNGNATDDSKRQLGGNSTNQENHITTETLNRLGNAVPVQIHGYEHQFKLQNRNKHPVFVDIWDISLKGSTNVTNNSDPSGLLQLFTSNEGSAPYYYSHGGTAKEQMNYLHPDFKIGWSKEFSDIWTKKHHVRVRLQPGEEHIHTVKAHMNFVFDPYVVDNQGISEFEGITQGTLFRTLGDMVHDADAEAGTFLPTIDGSIVDVIEVWKVNLSQVDPWRDTFHLNIAAVYPAEGHTRDTVERVELENPFDTSGVNTG